MGSDGAAALVLVSGQKAVELGLQVIAKITGYADAAQVLWENNKINPHNSWRMSKIIEYKRCSKLC